VIRSAGPAAAGGSAAALCGCALLGDS